MVGWLWGWLIGRLLWHFRKPLFILFVGGAGALYGYRWANYHIWLRLHAAHQYHEHGWLFDLLQVHHRELAIGMAILEAVYALLLGLLIVHAIKTLFGLGGRVNDEIYDRSKGIVQHILAAAAHLALLPFVLLGMLVRWLSRGRLNSHLPTPEYAQTTILPSLALPRVDARPPDDVARALEDAKRRTQGARQMRALPPG